jgi:hypothetical protein
VNCGACGTACDAGTGCFAGACRKPAAPTDTSDRAWCSAATGPDGKLYFFGGGNTLGGAATHASTMAFDPKTNQWSALPDEPTQRNMAGAATGTDGRIYVIGGVNASTARSTANEAFDTAASTWTMKASLPTGPYAVSAAAGNDGNIYLIGSDTMSAPVLNVYGTVDGGWTAGPPPISRGSAFVRGTDGLLYVTGGSSPSGIASDSLQIFDPAAGSWDAGRTASNALHSQISAPLRDGRILVAFGSTTATLLTHAEAYDPKTNTWSAIADSPGTLQVACATTGADGRVYVAGGSNAMGYNTALIVYSPTTNRWVTSN